MYIVYVTDQPSYGNAHTGDGRNDLSEQSILTTTGLQLVNKIKICLIYTKIILTIKQHHYTIILLYIYNIGSYMRCYLI